MVTRINAQGSARYLTNRSQTDRFKGLQLIKQQISVAGNRSKLGISQQHTTLLQQALNTAGVFINIPNKGARIHIDQNKLISSLKINSEQADAFIIALGKNKLYSMQENMGLSFRKFAELLNIENMPKTV